MTVKNYAELNGQTVVNIILADESFIANQPDPSIYVEYTEENPAFIDGDYVDGYFYNVKPYMSWTRDGRGNWICPLKKPDDALYWDEQNFKWVRIDEYTG